MTLKINDDYLEGEFNLNLIIRWFFKYLIPLAYFVVFIIDIISSIILTILWVAILKMGFGTEHLKYIINPFFDYIIKLNPYIVLFVLLLIIALMHNSRDGPLIIVEYIIKKSKEFIKYLSMDFFKWFYTTSKRFLKHYYIKIKHFKKFIQQFYKAFNGRRFLYNFLAQLFRMSILTILDTFSYLIIISSLMILTIVALILLLTHQNFDSDTLSKAFNTLFTAFGGLSIFGQGYQLLKDNYNKNMEK